MVVYTGAKNWVLGALMQNLTSTFGSGEVSSNMLFIQPIVTYTLPHGWYVALPDYNLSFNWRQGGEATIPLGLQVGKVIKFSERFALNLDVEFGVPIVKPPGPGTPNRVLGIEVSLMFL
jgi:hypothetical protein